ncbi:glycosyltransferase [Bradyrhizobium sediminis]|uniref:Glycosyltransferase n=1 Tax=Bradyrhizobium sediminis TaxID=2840469 RepID=A0A975P100_9BRAD|nr:glycosyltransferase [Bradyrhizobium sediminis]QWG25112.1 glycosyltransferase [Bradyrhizobium sediminis]
MTQPADRAREIRTAPPLVADEQAVLDRVWGEVSASQIKAAVVVLTFSPSDALVECLLRVPRIIDVVWKTPSGAKHGRNPGRLSFRLRTAFVVWSEDFAGLRWLMLVVRTGAFRIIKISRRGLRRERALTVRYVGREITSRLVGRVLRLLALSDNAVIRRLAVIISGARISRLKLASFPLNRMQADGPIVYATGSLGAGGSERQLMLTAKGVHSRSGRRVSVVCQSLLIEKNRFFASELETAGISVEDRSGVQQGLDQAESLQASFDDGSIRSAFSRNPQLADLILFFASKFSMERPAIVHAWLDETNIAAGVAAAISGVPKIVLGCRSLSPVNFQFYQPYMWQGYRQLARLPQVVILNNSAAGARDYADWLQIPIERIKVIPNGLEFSSATTPAIRNAFDASGDPVLKGKRIVGMVGRIAEEKRPYLWLEIASDILKKRSDVHFVWAGDGPMRKDVEKRAEELGISAHLSLLGLISDIGKVWASMTVFLLTSRVEGLPNVAIEAQHFGVPAVVAAVGGAAEAINEGVTGVSVAGDDAKAFSQAVLRFLDSPEALTRSKLLGPTFVQERFSVQRMLAATMSVYGLETRAS